MTNGSEKPTHPKSGPGAGAPRGSPVLPCQDRKIVLKLVTDDGYSIPEATFRLECEGGPTKYGKLDRNGRQTVGGLPQNTPFAVYYPDEEDIRAKAFAARLDDGLSQASPEMVLGVLMQSASELRAVALMLERYFKGPLTQRCRSVFEGHGCLPLVENLLARAGLFDKPIVIEYDKGR